MKLHKNEPLRNYGQGFGQIKSNAKVEFIMSEYNEHRARLSYHRLR